MKETPMTNVKKFQFDVPVSTDDGDYDSENSILTVEDLETTFSETEDFHEIAQLTIHGDGGHCSLRLSLNDADGLIDVLEHIRISRSSRSNWRKKP